MSNVSDYRPVIALVREAKAEVTEIKVDEEELEDSDIYVSVCEALIL